MKNLLMAFGSIGLPLVFFVNVDFQIAGKIVELQQDAVLEGLVPTLDLALCLGWNGAPRTAGF